MNDPGKILDLIGSARPQEAARLCRQQLVDSPGDPELTSLLGIALIMSSESGVGERLLNESADKVPDRADLRANLAKAQTLLGRPTEALAQWRRIATLPDCSPSLLSEAGTKLLDAGLADEAEAALRRSIAAAPSVNAHQALARILRGHNLRNEAGANLMAAHRLDSSHGGVLNDLGTVLKELGRDADAANCFQMAADIHNAPVLWGNLAGVLSRLLRFDDAEAAFSRAITPDPVGNGYRANRGLMRMLQGRWADGFADYEARFHADGLPPEPLQGPRWHGEALDGRLIALVCEQGLGDRIQFVRYASEAKRRGGKVVVVNAGPLTRMFGTAPGVDEALAGWPAEPYDVHAPLMSLPGILGDTPDTVPADIPYLAADPDLVNGFAASMGGLPGLKVGIAWRGNPLNTMDVHRSVGFDLLASLADIPGISLVSLHHDPSPEEESAMAGRCAPHDGKDLEDLAAILANVDLVISVDTAIAHLAGALGRPLWVLLPYSPDWRWLLGRDDSPWYPTARLFRQPSAGDWPSTLSRVAAELAAYSAAPIRS